MRLSIHLRRESFPALTNRSPANWRAWELLEPQIGLVPGCKCFVADGGIAKNSFQSPDGSSVVFEMNGKSGKRGDAPLSTQDRSSFMGCMNEILRPKETTIFRFEPGCSSSQT